MTSWCQIRHGRTADVIGYNTSKNWPPTVASCHISSKISVLKKSWYSRNQTCIIVFGSFGFFHLVPISVPVLCRMMGNTKIQSMYTYYIFLLHFRDVNVWSPNYHRTKSPFNVILFVSNVDYSLPFPYDYWIICIHIHALALLLLKHILFYSYSWIGQPIIHLLHTCQVCLQLSLSGQEVRVFYLWTSDYIYRLWCICIQTLAMIMFVHIWQRFPELGFCHDMYRKVLEETSGLICWTLHWLRPSISSTKIKLDHTRCLHSTLVD